MQFTDARVRGCGLPADGDANLGTHTHSLSGALLPPLPFLQHGFAHLLLLATGLIPLSVYSFLGAMPAWFTSALLRDLQQGMMARLAEVLRRREVLMAAVCPAPVGHVAASLALFPPGDAARQLTVAEYRAADHSPHRLHLLLPTTSPADLQLPLAKMLLLPSRRGLSSTVFFELLLWTRASPVAAVGSRPLEAFPLPHE